MYEFAVGSGIGAGECRCDAIGRRFGPCRRDPARSSDTGLAGLPCDRGRAAAEGLAAGHAGYGGGGQTAREVDDIGAETDAGGHLLIQSKKGLRLGSKPDSPLAKAIRQVVRQFVEGLPGGAADGNRVRALDPTRDRLIVVTDESAPESVRVGLADAVDRLAQLPTSLPFYDVAGSCLIVRARDAVLAHVRREWQALRQKPMGDGELRDVLAVLRVRVVAADDDRPDWRHAIGLLRKALVNPEDAHAAWSTLVKYFLEVPAKRQWADCDRLRGELRHHKVKLLALPMAWEAAGQLPKVRECDPRRLGVHAAITVPEAAGIASGGRVGELPGYVPRDVDVKLRAAVADAADHGGLIIVVGDSSTGKTRCAFEAIRAEVPDWPLLHPADSAQLTDIVSSGHLPVTGAVVWLDDLQHYLDGVNTLTIDTVSALLSADRQTVIIGTMWPEWYQHLTRQARLEIGNADLNWHSRRIVAAASVTIRLSDFTQRERDRAAALASEDPRWGFALKDRDFGPTQVLAGAPQLVDRWEYATDPYARAIITVGIDCHRLGRASTLIPELLRAAAPAYLEGHQVATAPADWFTTAVAYATEELRGATSALIPVPGSMMGSVKGYKVADYLLHYGEACRGAAPLSDLFWHASIGHTTDPDDLKNLASAARRRGRLYYAELAYRRAVNNGHQWALAELVDLLATQMRFDEAEQYCGRAGYRSNATILTAWADLLARQGRFKEAAHIYLRSIKAGHPEELYLRNEIRQLAKASALAAGFGEFAYGAFCSEFGGISHPSILASIQVDVWAAVWEGRLLYRVRKRIDAEGLHAREDTDQDNLAATDETEERTDEATECGRHLEAEGRLEEAEKIYRDRIHDSDTALFDLIDFLLKQGRENEADQAYRDAVKEGHPAALHGLAILQAWQGRTQESVRIRRYGLNADGETEDPDRVSNLPPQPELSVPQDSQ